MFIVFLLCVLPLLLTFTLLLLGFIGWLYCYTLCKPFSFLTLINFINNNNLHKIPLNFKHHLCKLLQMFYKICLLVIYAYTLIQISPLRFLSCKLQCLSENLSSTLWSKSSGFKLIVYYIFWYYNLSIWLVNLLIVLGTE